MKTVKGRETAQRNGRRIGKVLLFCAAALLLFSKTAVAERITSVSVTGNKRVEKETVVLYTGIKTGEDVTAKEIDRALKSLHQSTLFSDVKIEIRNQVLQVDVKENPLVSEVFFEGNDKLTDEQLAAEVSLKARTVFTKTRARNDTQRLLELYRRVGRYRAAVEPKIIERDQNRVDVVFEIKEGKPSYIEKIMFVGNARFSDSALKDAMMSKEHRFWRFLSSTDTYDPDRIAYDKEMIKRFYLSKGHADFELLSTTTELLPDRSGFYITFYINEGERYKISDISFDNRIKDFKEERLRSQLTFRKKDIYNDSEIERSVQRMTEELGIEGYAFVNIEPVLEKDAEKKELKVKFVIRETPKIFIDRINITGNLRTEDKVIRREFRAEEGDAFNVARLRRSKQRLDNLGYFEKVDLKVDPSPKASDKVNINVDVAERSTGSINLAIGYSTTNGALVTAGIKETNLLGKGLEIGLSGTLAQKEQQLDFSLTDPYFLNKDLLAGIDLYTLTRDRKTESSYDWEAQGGNLRFGYNYTEYLRQAIKYVLRDERIKNVQGDASSYVKRRAGESTVSMLNQTLSYDRRDSRFMPSSGYMLSLSTDIAGLGGTEKFLRFDINGSYYYPITDEVVFSLTGSYGHVFGYDNKDVSLNYRYYMGGDNLRGYQTAGAGGARDTATDDALGGNWMALGTAQLMFPIGFPKEVGIKGRVFFDAGMLGKPDDMDSTMFYSSKLRTSVGFGVVWNSMVGPIVLDWGWALNKEPHDETEHFRISFGMSF